MQEALFPAGLDIPLVQIWRVRSLEINPHLYSVKKEAQ